MAAGKWSSLHRRVHGLVLVSVPLAALTGLALWLPAWHTPLIPYLGRLEAVHVALGILLGLVLLLPVAWPPLPWRRGLSVGDWWVAAVLLGATVTSGLALWLPWAFPAPWRAEALGFHGVVSVALVAFWVVHGYRKWVLPRLTGLPARRTRLFPSERRRFLVMAGAAMGAWFAWVTGGSVLARLLSAPFRGVRHPAPQGEQGTWTVYTVTGTFPDIDPRTFRITVDGLVRTPAHLTLSELRALPATRLDHNFQCVTGWVVTDVHWEGVSLADLLRLFPPHPQARALNFYSADGVYTDSLTFADARRLGALLVYRMDGRDLPREHGGPVRLFVPGMYGYKSVKWVQRVEYARTPLLGYWEVRGYPAEAWIQRGPVGPGGPVL